MNTNRIADILTNHCINYRIDANGHIYGIIPYTSASGDGEKITDLTNYNKRELLAYLGY